MADPAQLRDGDRRLLEQPAPGMAELMLNAVLNSATDFAIFTIDARRQVTSWNIGAQNLLGWGADEIMGQSVDLIFTPGDREHGIPALETRQALANGRAADERFHLRKDGTRFWSSGLLMPLRGDDEGRGFLKILRDRTDQWTVREQLRESEARFRHLAEHGPAIVWISDSSAAITYRSRSWYDFTGQTPEAGLGLGWLDALHPDDRSRVREAFLRANEARQDYQVEYRLRRTDETYRWVLSAATPRFDENGTYLGYVGSALDISERKQAEEHQQILLAELQHQVRNTLAVIRLILRRTAETAENVEAFTSHFDGRLNALARVQTAVTRDPTAGIDLEYLVADELLVYTAPEDRGGRLDLSGSAILLQPKAAETLGLAIHELATNALKYGALATAEGRIKVTWQRHDTGTGPSLRFDWVETGVPINPGSPRRRGFGTELLERTLPYELGAQTSATYERDGLRCRIEIPLTKRIVV